jgi:hypothetical protein
MIATTWSAAVLGQWSGGHMMDGSAGWHWAWMTVGLLAAVVLVVAAAWLGARAGAQGRRQSGRSAG